MDELRSASFPHPTERSSSSVASRRRLSAVVAGADALTHTVPSGTNVLSIGSDQAVKVEDVRFSGSNVGLVGDVDLLGLTSGRLTVNGDLTVTGSLASSAPCAFFASKSSNAAVTAGGTVTFDSEMFDVGGDYDTSNSRFTAPAAGVYSFSQSFLVLSGNPNIRIYKNGADSKIALIASGTATTVSYSSPSITFTISLAANDYITVAGYDANGSIYGAAHSFHSFFTGHRVA